MRFLSMAGWCPVVEIMIIFIPSPAPYAPIGLISTPLPLGSQLNDGTVNALCFTVMMLRYLRWKVVF